jgi:hypothetical protein
VRFEVIAPFQTAGYCHCKRCQRRSGALWTYNAMVPGDGLRILQGEESIRTWRPESGMPKAFCEHCGGHVYSGDPAKTVGVRLGTVDGDPGIRAQWRQWLESAPGWEPIPDDGVPRFQQQRPA